MMNTGDQLTERVKKHTQSQVVIEEEEYTYSDNGHMTSRVLTTGGNDYTTSYQYDVGGNLKQVTLPDSATVTYQYDAYGNRVKKQTASEKVSYEYAGGSCQREIHRNLSDTILYTLRYYPWGFTKTVPGTPDVTTTYYYLVDTRGWVWGLTDGDGAILETYQYSPYGELLSTPSITHSRFLSGADECLWDSETGLYYLHARYYDPQLGRFIQEDIVEGDLEFPASQNRYTYCQNDPVSLVDPSGYSPQNTNTPSRFGQFNIANLDSPYGCSLSDLQPVLPELQPSSGGEVISPEEMFVYDSCNKVSWLKGAIIDRDWEKEFLEMGGTITTNSDGSTTYTMNIDGEEVQFTVDKNGNVKGYATTEKGQVIVNSILNSLNDIGLSGGTMTAKEVGNLLMSVQVFYDNYYDIWYSITQNKDNMLTEFLHHAVIGGFISTQMQKYGVGSSGYNYNQYDMIFGFWASYFSTILGIPISLLPGKKGVPGPDDPLSLVDVANLMKAVGFQETRLGEDSGTGKPNSEGFGGIMQVPVNGESGSGLFIFDIRQKEIDGANRFAWIKGAPRFFVGDWGGFYNAFNNIGIGAGYLFAKLIACDKDSAYSFWSAQEAGLALTTPTFAQWKLAIEGFGDQTDQYLSGVVELFLTGKHPHVKKRLFNPNSYFNKRQFRP